MSPEEFPEEFLHGMIEQLDGTIRELMRKEKSLCVSLGESRVGELTEYWEHAMTVEEESELKRSMDFRDRELVWVWARLKRARASRVNAGKAYMQNLSPVARGNDKS